MIVSDVIFKEEMRTYILNLR